MKIAFSLPLALAWLSLVSTSLCTQISNEDYTTWREVEDALLNSNSNNDSIPNLFMLKESFFPLESPEPFCVPVEYRVVCASQGMGNCPNCVNCTQSEFVSQFLWTQYNVKEAIGAVLLSYAYDGIELVGFNSWESVCSFTDGVSLTLNMSVLTYNEQTVVLKSLLRLTSQVSSITQSALLSVC